MVHTQWTRQYTIGQRKGLGVASPAALCHYETRNTQYALVVGMQDEELGVTEITVRDVNWMNGEMPSEPFRAEVKIRYTAKEAEAWSAQWKGSRRRLV